MKINLELKEILSKVNFLYRFKSLSDSYPITSFENGPNINVVSKKITDRGYRNTYNKKHKFFKISKDDHKFTSLNFAAERGKAEFILSASIHGEPCGKTFAMLTLAAGAEERLKNPHFSNYEQLDKILDEGLSIYEDIASKVNEANQ